MGLAPTNQHQTISSLDIAKATNKQHSHVIRDIRALLDTICDKSATEARFFKDRRGYVSAIHIPASVRDLLLSKYSGLASIPNSLQEKAALAAIEQVLGVTLVRQYRVGSYRIDGYDATNNVAYEIDEAAHKYQRDKDLARQGFIQRELGCRFVRIKV